MLKHYPPIHLVFNKDLLEETHSQYEILTVVIFILVCTGWATALRYQMIAYSVFPGVDVALKASMKHCGGTGL